MTKKSLVFFLARRESPTAGLLLLLQCFFCFSVLTVLTVVENPFLGLRFRVNTAVLTVLTVLTVVTGLGAVGGQSPFLGLP